MSLFTRRNILWLAGIMLLPVGLLYTLSFMIARPTTLGVTNGRLAVCPPSPNCVSTQADVAAQFIEPFKFQGPSEAAFLKLKAVLSQQPRMKIVTESDNYLHVEVVSFVFRFVDDVEFLLDETQGVINFRSASRIGHSDLGVNRARMERIRAAWDRG